MALLHILKKHALDFAVNESKAAVHGWGFWEHDERERDGAIFFADARKAHAHLALTRRIVDVRAHGPAREWERVIGTTKWKSIIRDRTYKVVLTHLCAFERSEREIAKAVWAIAQGSVDMKTPQVTIDVVVAGDTLYAGVRAFEESERFEDRRAHAWPAPHPSAMHPALARALCVMACSSSIDDPFCGAGGILIEAGLAGMRASGGDIDRAMIVRARANCAHYALAPALRIADATIALKRTGAIVTDLPFGKSTKGGPHLARAFLARARASTRRVVVGFPERLRLVAGWKMRAHMSVYAHKNLTRHFYVLERV